MLVLVPISMLALYVDRVTADHWAVISLNAVKRMWCKCNLDLFSSFLQAFFYTRH